MAVKKYSKKADGNKSLSKNFKVKEFACKDGSDYILIDDELVKVLQKIRDKFGKPVTITSAYRNAAYNKKVGGVSNSQHTKGTASDIQVKDIAPKVVAEFVESIMPNQGGIGLYSNFIHVDTRAKRSRWQNFGKEVSVSGFPGYTPPKIQYSDIVEKLFSRNLITDKDLWQKKLVPNSNAYYLGNNAINLTKNGLRWAELRSINDIVWELGYRGIITDTVLWLKLLKEDENLYWLAYNICNKTMNKIAPKKEEPFKYHVEGITHIVEVEPLKISAVETQCSTKQVPYDNFVNGTFFWYDNKGTRYPVGMVVNNGKVLGNCATHEKPVATLIIHTDGSVEMKYVTDITKENDVKFAISGFGVYPEITASKEGFTGTFTDVLRSCNRPIIGYRKSDNKIVIAVRSLSSAERAKKTAKNLGLDFAISLDGGGSTTFKVGGKWKFKGDNRKIYGGIIFA